MTRLEAFNLAKAEIETFGFTVKRVCLNLPTEAPTGTFYAFFENPITGEMLCRTYFYDREERGISFVEVLNPKLLKLRNPALVQAYLENGNFIYRNVITATIKNPKEENGVISLFRTRMLSMPT